MLGRLWLALGVVPFAVAAVIGMFAPFLFDRTLMVSSWAPILAVAFALDLLRRRFGFVGSGLVCVTLAVIAALVVLVPGVQALGGGRHGRAPRAGRGATVTSSRYAPRVMAR